MVLSSQAHSNICPVTNQKSFRCNRNLCSLYWSAIAIRDNNSCMSSFYDGFTIALWMDDITQHVVSSCLKDWTGPWMQLMRRCLWSPKQIKRRTFRFMCFLMDGVQGKDVGRCSCKIPFEFDYAGNILLLDL